MSKTQILLLIILVIGIVYGVVRHPQTRKYLPGQVTEVADRLTIDQLNLSMPNFNQLGSKIPIDNLPQNQFTTWLKSKVEQPTEEAASSSEDTSASDNQSLQTSQDGSSTTTSIKTDDQTTNDDSQANSDAQTDDESISDETFDANDQIKTLTSRAVEIGEETKKVLGASIQPAEEESGQNKPIYQSVIESGMYYYCKQVVTDYEKSHPTDNQ